VLPELVEELEVGALWLVDEVVLVLLNDVDVDVVGVRVEAFLAARW
jgi:hypothetical protein